MSDAGKTLIFDPNRVNRPFVPKENERSLFQEEIARFWDIFEALEQDQWPALKDARKANGNSVLHKRSRAKAIEGWSSGSNIVGIFGKRGSGKSSLMLSFFERLSLDIDPSSGDSNASGKNYPIWLDPALFMNRRLADVFLAKMYGMFKNWFEDDSTNHAIRTEGLQKKLHEAFQRVQRAFSGIRSADEKGFSLGDLLLTSEANTIQRNVFDLVELMLEAMNHKEGKLVLFLDDFDLQERDVSEHLEDWKHFLNLPNVVVVLSAAKEEFVELLLLGRMKDRMELIGAGTFNGWQSLATDGKSAKSEIAFNAAPWVDRSELSDRANAHLLKIIGPNRALYLEQNKGQYADFLEFYYDNKDGDKWVNVRIRDFLVSSAKADLGVYFYVFSNISNNEKNKFNYDLNTWRDSSLRVQMTAMMQLLDSSESALRHANFSGSEIRQLQQALPSKATRLKFTAEVVRWITLDRNAKSGQTLKQVCEKELGMELRSSWQAFLLVNQLWTLLGHDGDGDAPSINFLDVKADVEMNFWGGPAKVNVTARSIGYIKTLSDPNKREGALCSKFWAELMAAEFWLDGKEWKPQLLRTEPMLNPINAIPRLILGWSNEAHEDGAPKPLNPNGADSDLQHLFGEFDEWWKVLKGSSSLFYLEQSLANPIFFSSLLSTFTKGSQKRDTGVEGFFKELAATLVTNLKQVVGASLRDPKLTRVKAISIDELWDEQQGKMPPWLSTLRERAELRSEILKLLDGHPLNRDEVVERFNSVIQNALTYNRRVEESEGEVLEAIKGLQQRIKDWNRYLKYLYSRRDGFVPVAWEGVPDPGAAAKDLKRRARAIQVYLSREVHRHSDVEARAEYSELNTVRMAEPESLVRAAGSVYAVIQAYISYLQGKLAADEAELERLNRQEAESK